VQTGNAQVVVLVPECSSEIRNDDRFSFTHLLAEVSCYPTATKAMRGADNVSNYEFLGHIPAFINFSPHNDLNDMAKEVLTKKLNPSFGKLRSFRVNGHKTD
jgi:hypothetical protein